tara:strand:+ start:1025 stop:1861 length:837 start_codon:yes stop_codon:yes gene_type:complete
MATPFENYLGSMGFNLSDLTPSQYGHFSNEYNTMGPIQSIGSRPTSMEMPITMNDAIPLGEQLGYYPNNGIMEMQNQGTLNYPEVNWKGITPVEGARTLIPNPDYRDYTEGELYDINIEEDEENPWYASLLDHVPFVGDKSLSGILLNAFNSGRNRLTDFRDAIGTRLGPSPYGTSQAAMNAMTPSQRQSVASIYGQGGIMQGYNPVSAYGKGPRGAIQNRISNIQNRKAAQTDASRQKIKDLQIALANVGGGDGGGGNQGGGFDNTFQESYDWSADD